MLSVPLSLSQTFPFASVLYSGLLGVAVLVFRSIVLRELISCETLPIQCVRHASTLKVSLNPV